MNGDTSGCTSGWRAARGEADEQSGMNFSFFGALVVRNDLNKFVNQHTVNVNGECILRCPKLI